MTFIHATETPASAMSVVLRGRGSGVVHTVTGISIQAVDTSHGAQKTLVHLPVQHEVTYKKARLQTEPGLIASASFSDSLRAIPSLTYFEYTLDRYDKMAKVRRTQEALELILRDVDPGESEGSDIDLALSTASEDSSDVENAPPPEKRGRKETRPGDHGDG